MKKNASPSLAEQLERSKRDWSAFKEGKTRLRTWKVEGGDRRMSYRTYRELFPEKAQPQAALSPQDLKRIREDALKVSQRVMAEALGVSYRTLQGWEMGKGTPPMPVVHLMELMRDMPSVRRRLFSA